MLDNFDSCLRTVLKWEGGKVNDPQDPGGKTNQGVTQRTYDAWRASQNLPKQDVYLLTAAERDAIYREQYWNAIEGDALPRGLDLMVFDAAVLSGPVQAIKWLQRALQPTYTGLIDGHLGAATRQAIRLCNVPKTIEAMTERRLAFFKQLAGWPRFGAGWTRRVTSVRVTAVTMATAGTVVATKTPPVVGESANGASVKAPIQTADPAPTKAIADTATGGGVAFGTAAATIESARASISGLAATNDAIVTKIVVGLALFGMMLTLCGLLWRAYQEHRAKVRADALDLPSAAN